MESNNVQDRINELIAELNDCREDERNTQSQILEVISVAGAILGILFSASYLNDEKNKCIIVFANIGNDNANYIYKLCNMINENVTYARIMFLLSLFVFCTAFAYIIVLGTNNILRYYYIQNLEDRLHELISNTPDDRRGSFLHWNSYNAPIITRNISHISSTHTALIYFCYSVATGCVILFSIAMVTSLFLEIMPKKRFDYITVSIIIILMLLTAFLFLHTSSKAKEVAQFAWDTARENQKKRLEENSHNLYDKSKSFKRIMLYFIYPKKQDLQKPILIILGFAYGIILMDVMINPMYIWRLMLVLITFDFLAYQARYQINDIRGLKEDREAGCKNRLPLDDFNNPGEGIKISFIVALVKIAICLIISMLFGETIKNCLLISLTILFISTIFYEFARSEGKTRLIFVSVGIGYPLRFFVGFFSAVLAAFNLYSIQMILFVIALWAYGSFASILSWTNEVIARIQKEKLNNGCLPFPFEKKHFNDIQNIILDEYNLGRGNFENASITSLREKGRFRDPWNMAMVVSVSCIFLITCVGKIPIMLLWLESIALIAFVINIYAKYKMKVALICIGWICIICKIFIGLFFFNISVWYLLLSVIQMIVTITYFILLYQPQIKKVDYKEIFNKLIREIKIKILGEYAFSIIENEKMDIK